MWWNKRGLWTWANEFDLIFLSSRAHDSQKHSSFSTTFPIYLYELKTEEVPDLDLDLDTEEEVSPPQDEDDEFVSSEDNEESEEIKAKVIPMKNVTTEEWVHLNNVTPLWQL